jgi:thiol-disulfide isomerase/thioredoxin
MRMRISSPVVVTMLAATAACAEPQQPTPVVQTGRVLDWTGAGSAWIILPSGAIEFKIAVGPESGHVSISNADETIRIPVVFDDGKTVTLRFDDYDSEIRCEPVDGSKRVFKGEWVKRRGPNGAENEFVRLPFHLNASGQVGAESRLEVIGEEERTLATLNRKPRWRVKFADDEDTSVLLFRPKGPAVNQSAAPVAATFLTTTGDYRYLTPRVVGDTITLSCFDGSHAFLFHSRLLDDGTLKGDFWSGPTYHTTWTATPDPDAKLPDGFSLTTPVPGFDLATLRYPGLDGVERPLIPTAAKDVGEPSGVKPKVHIIELFGTWCPNCKDAAAYLKELHAKYATRGLEITALAFEVTGDRERDLRQLGVYRDCVGVPYAMLLAGTNDKKKALASFPAVERIKAYPTFLFVDAGGKVRATYTGFSGPATGDEHAAMKGRFEKLIEAMLAE